MKIDPQIMQAIAVLKAPAVIAVSGFGGSGKSTFAALLGNEMNIAVVGIDSFIKDRNLADYSLWAWMDYDRFEKEVIAPFKEGKTFLEYGHFDWLKNEVGEIRKVSTKRFLMIEGVGLFRPELLKYFDYKIWINCSIAEAILRGKKRDQTVNARDEEYHTRWNALWDGIWKKNDLECFEAYRPKEIADFILDNG